MLTEPSSTYLLMESFEKGIVQFLKKHVTLSNVCEEISFEAHTERLSVNFVINIKFCHVTTYDTLLYDKNRIISFITEKNSCILYVSSFSLLHPLRAYHLKGSWKKCIHG